MLTSKIKTLYLKQCAGRQWSSAKSGVMLVALLQVKDVQQMHLTCDHTMPVALLELLSQP